jgi:hypothetical protein
MIDVRDDDWQVELLCFDQLVEREEKRDGISAAGNGDDRGYI